MSGESSTAPVQSAVSLPRRWDLLRVPLLGRFLRWPWSRVVMQTPVLILSLVMIAHAFFGPQLAPKNLAALLTWVHFRGLIVLVLLVAGNVFCMACPFMLPRQLARRWVTPRWDWPSKLRTKWVAIGLFVAILFVYEWLDLWADPWSTGVMIVGYFTAAFVVDVCFRRASFCKYVCPVGQFNFLGSTMSPLEVAVRDLNICTTCQTKDCILGRHGESEGGSVLPVIQRGCELDLFQPRKVGNLDCTFCLDCVYACPHDNVGILARIPGEELAIQGTRSGIGDLDGRPDWSGLIILFVFGAVLNAFAMISPVYALERELARLTGLTVEWPILALIFAVALVVEPFILVGGAALATRRAVPAPAGLALIVKRFSRSLVPIGFGVWLAHYGFHFLTGALTVIPVTQNAVRAASGRAWFGQPQWEWTGLSEPVVFAMEMGFLGLGLLGSLLVAWRIAEDFAPRQAFRAFTPWAVVNLLLFVAACWILTQPMDMRGTFVAG